MERGRHRSGAGSFRVGRRGGRSGGGGRCRVDRGGGERGGFVGAATARDEEHRGEDRGRTSEHGAHRTGGSTRWRVTARQFRNRFAVGSFPDLRSASPIREPDPRTRSASSIPGAEPVPIRVVMSAAAGARNLCRRMKTRTLLLLALACGLAIMVAGAVFLFQLTTQDDLAEPVPIGVATRVADMDVVVEGWEERGDELSVAVRVGGVDDPDGAEGFRLIASGRPLVPVTTGAGGNCGATTVEERACVVNFDVSTADGTSRVLFYERGDQQARWVLG